MFEPNNPFRQFIERQLVFAVFFSFVFAAISAYVKALWIDEFWSFFFSDQTLNFIKIFSSRMRAEFHPPLFYSLLYGLRHITNDPFGIRIIFIVVFYTILLFFYLRTPKHETDIRFFLLFITSSYWAIYYTVEIRPYGLVFLFAIFSVLLLKKIIEGPPKSFHLGLWLILSLASAATHYFSALWMCSLCGLLGLYFIAKARYHLAFMMAMTLGATLVAELSWIRYSFSSPDLQLDPVGSILGWESFKGVCGQGCRALLKTLASNIPLSFLTVMGILSLWRHKKPLILILGVAILANVLITLGIHTFFYPMARERTFIVLVPAIVFLMTSAALEALSDSKNLQHRNLESLPQRSWNLRLWKAVPVMALITPLLFSSEFFKDLPQMGKINQVLAKAGRCNQAIILTHYRYSRHPEFMRQYADLIISGGYAKPDFLRSKPDDWQGNAKALQRQPDAPILIEAGLYDSLHHKLPITKCRIKAALLNLPHGKTSQEEAEGRAFLIRSGVPLNRLKEISLGSGRQKLFELP